MTEFFRRYIYSNAPLILSLAALGWAGNTVAGRLAVGEISPMVIVFMRWTIVAGLLGYTQRHSWPKALPLIKGRLKWVFAMAGFGFTFFNALFYTAAQYTTAINLGIIQCTMPAYIILGAAIIFRNRLTSLQLAGTALTMIGVVIIIAKGDVQILAQLAINQGDWLMLLACLFYSGYTIGLRNRPQIGNFTMMFFLAIAAWLLSLPLLLAESLTSGLLWPDDIQSWLVILFVALVPSFLSQIFYMRGVDLIGPARAGVFSNLVPVYSAALGILILNEALHLFHILSCVLVFGGLAIISRQKQSPAS
ncbi:MAG: DMT family transporter [Proteobacteria bacterium]|nr:DMT family transporter [Pseudomonadota bacterium]